MGAKTCLPASSQASADEEEKPQASAPTVGDTVRIVRDERWRHDVTGGFVIGTKGNIGRLKEVSRHQRQASTDQRQRFLVLLDDGREFYYGEGDIETYQASALTAVPCGAAQAGSSSAASRQEGSSTGEQSEATVTVTPQWAASGSRLDELRVAVSSTVAALSAGIASGLSDRRSPSEELPLLQLVFAGKVLAPDSTLEDLGVGDSVVIDIVRLNPEFQIIIDRTEGGKLGVDVDFSDEATLLIDAITPGLIQHWNDANPTLPVRRIDRIVEVNGYRGDYGRLVDECRRDAILNMVIRRSKI